MQKVKSTKWNMKSAGSCCRIELRQRLFADGAYDRGQLMDKATFPDFVIEVVQRIDGQDGFEILPRRRGVGRTFGLMIRWKRFVRDYETRVDVSVATIQVAMASLLLRRFAH